MLYVMLAACILARVYLADLRHLKATETLTICVTRLGSACTVMSSAGNHILSQSLLELQQHPEPETTDLILIRYSVYYIHWDTFTNVSPPGFCRKMRQKGPHCGAETLFVTDLKRGVAKRGMHEKRRGFN